MVYNVYRHINKRSGFLRIGYIRVSTQEQNTDRQVTALTTAGAKKLYIDKTSGKNTNRQQLQELMEYVRAGDTVIVNSISRFARNTRDLLELVDQLRKKDVEFVSLKESIDTTTAAGKFMLTIFAAVAELERDYILDRQKEGIASAHARGLKFGRPKAEKPEQWDTVYQQWKAKEITAVKAMEMLGLKKSTFYKLLKEVEGSE